MEVVWLDIINYDGDVLPGSWEEVLPVRFAQVPCITKYTPSFIFWSAAKQMTTYRLCAAAPKIDLDFCTVEHFELLSETSLKMNRTDAGLECSSSDSILHQGKARISSAHELGLASLEAIRGTVHTVSGSRSMSIIIRSDTSLKNTIVKSVTDQWDRISICLMWMGSFKILFSTLMQ